MYPYDNRIGPLTRLGLAASQLGQAWLMAQKSPAELEVERIKQRYYSSQAEKAEAEAARERGEWAARQALQTAVAGAFGGGPVRDLHDYSNRLAGVLPHAVAGDASGRLSATLARVLGAVTPAEAVASAASLAGGGSAPGMNEGFTPAYRDKARSEDLGTKMAIARMRSETDLEQERMRLEAAKERAAAKDKQEDALLPPQLSGVVAKMLGLPPEEVGPLSQKQAQLLAAYMREMHVNNRMAQNNEVRQKLAEQRDEMEEKRMAARQEQFEQRLRASAEQFDARHMQDALQFFERTYRDMVTPDIMAEATRYALSTYGNTSDEALRRGLYAVAEIVDPWLGSQYYRRRSSPLLKHEVDAHFGGPLAKTKKPTPSSSGGSEPTSPAQDATSQQPAASIEPAPANPLDRVPGKLYLWKDGSVWMWTGSGWVPGS